MGGIIVYERGQERVPIPEPLAPPSPHVCSHQPHLKRPVPTTPGHLLFFYMPLRSDLGLAQTWGPKSVSWVGGQLYSERDSADLRVEPY